MRSLPMPSALLFASLVAVVLLFYPISAAAQYRYPAPYPYAGGYGYAGELRVNVKPNTAAVYVDGYFAGKVDDFDSPFQRLRVESGRHEIAIYLEGYRTLRQQVYIGPGASQKIAGTLERLGPGEAAEGPPTPIAPVDSRDRDPRDSSEPRDPRDSRDPRYAPPPEAPRRASPPAPQTEIPPSAPSASSSSPSSSSPGLSALTVLVDPGNAEVLIDGDRRRTGSRDEWLVVRVEPGKHAVQVRKDGYRPFSTELDVSAGETVPLIVTLTPER